MMSRIGVVRSLLLVCLCMLVVTEQLLAQPAATTMPATRPATRPAEPLGNPTIGAPKLAVGVEQFMRRHQMFLERARANNIDLLFLGDSITQIWERAGAEVWKQHYSSLNAANFGIGGDRTQNVIWRIENGELDGISPKVVVLLIGTNNVPTAHDAQQITAGISKIVQMIRTKLPETKVLLMALYPRSGEANMEKINQINSALARLEDTKMIRFLNINSKLVDADGNVNRELLPDGLHLNEAGYKIWAESMKPLLEEMMK
jgi:beta-glucosidase